MHIICKASKKIIKAVAFSLMFFAGLILLNSNLFAWVAEGASCTADDFVWPTISLTWRGTDPYFSYGPGGVSPYTIHNTCSANCCWDVSFFNEVITVDGNVEFDWAALSEGGHSVQVTIKASNGSGDPHYYMEASYSTSGTFSIDKTNPTITFTKPENNVFVATNDAVLSGNISDLGSRVGVIWLRLGVQDGPCMFKKDFSSATVNLSQIEVSSCTPRESSTACVMPIQSSFAINYDLLDYVDFSAGKDCKFSVIANASDRVGNSTAAVLSFAVDQAPPVIYISSWPVVLSSGPATLISGVTTDASEIKKIEFTLRQTDWQDKNTYWNGSDWVADTTTINISIPQSTHTVKWTYNDLPAKYMISGSHYLLTVHSTDKFDHVGVAEQEFYYNTCTEGIINHPPQTAHRFEVGDAVFRELGSPGFKNKGHAGVYILSDSNYQLGQSSSIFVDDLKLRRSLRDIVGSDARHYIVEATGYKHFLIEKDYAKAVSIDEYIAGGLEYWGAKTAKTPIESERREQIAYNAALQLGKIYELKGDWAGGKDKANPVGFRCDGLVIYAYELAGINLIPTEKYSYRKMNPRKLAKEYMVDSVIDYPMLQNILITPKVDSPDIRLAATTYDASSGIDRLEYYLYTKEGNTLRKMPLVEEEEDSVSSRVYYSTCACNPGGNLVAKLVDRAGNWATYDYSKTRQSTSDPKEPSVTISPDSPPIIDTPIIKTGNGNLTCNVPAVSDDITPASSTLLFYSVDRSYDDWTDDDKTQMLDSSLASGNFYVAPGAHKLYVAVMDESLNFTAVEKGFNVPGFASASLGNNARMTIGNVAITFDNLTNLASVSANDTTGGTLPSGYSNLPRALSKEITIDGEYQGGFFVVMNYANSGVTPEQEPYLQMLHNGQNITVALDRTNKLISGYATSASPFTVAVSQQRSPESSLPDVWPPLTSLTTIGNSYSDSQGRSYISTETFIGLSAQDDRVGRVKTYYTPNMTESLFSMGLVPEAAAQFTRYTSSFTIAEGVHWIGYGSADAVPNYELLKTTTFYVDGTSPETQLLVGSSTISSDENVYITAADSITYNASDPVSNGIASDVKAKYILIDVSSDSCQTDPAMTGPVGTCENPVYTVPFTLTAGTHTVYYVAEDNAGNRSELKSHVFTVTSVQAVFSIMPSSGPIGVPFTITGSGFGAYSAGTTVVLIGGVPAPLTLWSTSTIKGTIPGSLASGEQAVAIMRGTSTIAAATSFNVTAPALSGLSPSSGAIGLPFTLTGENFGNYVANYTRVLLGGVTVPLTLWTDTKIQGTIPGTLPVGDYGLYVERALNGGVVRSSSATFSLKNMEAYWLAPSSGPIGMPFTITGTGFGNYAAAYADVLVGGTTAPLSLWTDTKIQGTVPGSMPVGQYPVLVERHTADGGLMQTSSMTFEVLTVDVSSMTPVAGPIGLPFTINGANFGNYVANFTRVLIGGATAPLTLWSTSQIQGTIPGALTPGEYPVIVERELNSGIVRSTAIAFVVSAPAAFNITPSSGAIGVPFTINGANFGNYSAAYTGVLINGATVPLTLWTDNKIQGTIPGGLAAGQYPVKVVRNTADGGTVKTSALAFEVLGVSVSSMSPVGGPIGLPFTIYGSNFGNYVANYTKVLIGGTTTPLTLWSDTKIQGTIPGSLGEGEYPVVVERTLNGGQVQSSTLTFSVALPVAYTLSPSSGPIGLPFTIQGLNFGNYVANYTKVLIGGATAPLSLWTDSKIQGTIPGALTPGDYELYVERALNNGVVRTSSSIFTVAVPYLDTVSPSTSPVIGPFSITGFNFGNYVAGYTKVLINGATTPLSLWTDTKIQGTLPFLLAGTYPVQVQRYLNGGLAESATAYVAVAEPVISSMTPTTGAVGTVFNVFGTGFGPYSAATTKVTIDGVVCAVSLWTDTKLTGTVPSGISYGTHTVTAMRGQALSNPIEFNLPGSYSPSMVRSGSFASSSALEFKLGEVYVYPDPAKGGKVPTFHIEVGTADTVKLRVFTVAGALVHEKTLSGNPQAAGSAYAYEYAWTGHIASGVYYYTMEAERAGKKLKARGKFAVVR